MAPLMAPRGTPTGVGWGRARWVWEAFPTLWPLAAPDLQLTPQAQGLKTSMWSLGTGSLETCSLHGGCGQGPPAQMAPVGLGAEGEVSERFKSPQLPTQWGAQRVRKFKMVTRVAASAQGTKLPLNHLAHGAQLPCSPPHSRAQAASSRPAQLPIELWPLLWGGGS